jgi:hypothetical protein
MKVKTIALALCALLVAGIGFAQEKNPFVSASDPHGILDFARPPNELVPARLVVIDGTNVNANVTRTSFWVSPGVHEIVVAAAISMEDSIGLRPNRSKESGESSKDVTIEVKEGMRYKIAGRLLDHKGNWEPVVWKEEKAKD